MKTRRSTARCVVAACGRIQQVTGAAIILGHHTPWDPNTQRPKGSSKIPDCADAVYLLENMDGALKLTCQKMRDAERPAPIALKLSKVDAALVVDADTRPKAHPSTQLTGEAAKVYAALTPGMRYSEWLKAYGGKAKTFETALARLRLLRLVKQDPETDLWYPVQGEFEIDEAQQAI